MSILPWSDHLCTGIPSLDPSNKQMVDTANVLYNLAREKNSGPDLEQALEALVHFVGHHLDHQDTYMIQVGYPDFLSHKGEHDLLREKVRSLRETGTGATGPALANESLAFLKSLVRGHILNADARFAAYLMAGGSIETIGVSV